MRLLVLITDGFGGRGGIAKFNRDLLTALTAHAEVDEVVAFPRVIVDPCGALPQRLSYVNEAAGGKARFVKHLLGRLTGDRRFDAVICGHINLLPLAAVASWRTGSPLLLITHGIEAWLPLGGSVSTRLNQFLARRISAVVTVSALTRERMSSWLDIDHARSFVVPNCIDVAPFGPGPKSEDLLIRYGLADATVLMTMARLSAGERYKGVDEVLELLPRLAQDVPDVKYLVCGDGDDAERLQSKTRELGLADRVVFAGYITDEEKADHYRLADAFVMPGRGEGFGIVYLEALACGVPVVASSADASREAVLDGELGEVVDPDDPDDVREGILAALARPRQVPAGLRHFHTDRFVERWHRVLDTALSIERPIAEPPAPAAVAAPIPD